MIRKTKTRPIVAWMLLAVFVPMLLLSSIHFHEEVQTDDSCIECVHHNCGGHLGQQTVSLHPCVLCQFLTLSMQTAGVATVTIYSHVCKLYFAQPSQGKFATGCGTIVTRGPPTAWQS